jgi:Ca2+-binding EF-hand superfamily protein
MTRFAYPLIATSALLAAVPALGAEEDMAGYCQTAFYPADKDGDGTVTEKEVSAQRDAQFSQIDANGDGSIDRDEFLNCVGQAEKQKISAFSGGSADYEVGEWSDLKLDRKEDLTAEEFAALSKEAWESGDAEMQSSVSYSEDAQSEEEFAAAAVDRFRKHDANGDGVLSKSEYETPAREETWSDEEMTKRFDSLDANGDGVISPMEYHGAATQALDTAGMMDDGNSQDTSSSNGESASGADGLPVFEYYILVM